MCEAYNIGILNLVFSKSFLCSGFLYADGLAVKVFYLLELVSISLADDYLLFCRKIVIREIHGFLTFICRVDACDSHINLTACQGRKKSLEIHVLHFKLDAQLVSNLLCQFHINPDDLLFTGTCVYEFIWRITGSCSHNELAAALDLMHKRAFSLSRLACCLIIASTAACDSKSCYSCCSEHCQFHCIYLFHHFKHLSDNSDPKPDTSL